MAAMIEGRAVEIRISDPFELGESRGWAPIEAIVVSVRSGGSRDAMLLRALQPFEYSGTHCEFLVAAPRHQGCGVDDLAQDGTLFCNLTCIPPTRIDAPDPYDLSRWRGGLAIIGEVALLRPSNRTPSSHHLPPQPRPPSKG